MWRVGPGSPSLVNCKSAQVSSEECQDVECLNTLVQVLRMNRDSVTNFLKQRKRLVSRISLLANKASKNNKTNASLDHLADALGGSTTLKSSSPICGGRYNSTSATQVKLSLLVMMIHKFFFRVTVCTQICQNVHQI